MDRFTNDGMGFDVSDSGSDGPAVLLLHGFPADRHCWNEIAATLVAAGYRTLAPDQRGYPPQARPRRRRDYTVDKAATDALALADAAGVDTFHVVGHDWGASVAWSLAAHRPDRVRSLTALSVPHPQAYLRSLTRSTQLLSSWYFLLFQVPYLPERVLRTGGGAWFRAQLIRSGLDEASADRYARRATERDAISGPLNWYRAAAFNSRVPPVAVPTLYVWSDRDGFLTRTAAELCGRSVMGPYRFEVLNGVSHWIPETAPTRTADLILQHLRSDATAD